MPLDAIYHQNQAFPYLPAFTEKVGEHGGANKSCTALEFNITLEGKLVFYHKKSLGMLSFNTTVQSNALGTSNIVVIYDKDEANAICASK